jgi:hypothetical protein
MSFNTDKICFTDKEYCHQSFKVIAVLNLLYFRQYFLKIFCGDKY